MFHLQTRDAQVAVARLDWQIQGEVNNWLMSDVFCLPSARSLAGEQAIAAALAFMRGDLAALPQDLRSQQQIHARLQRVLPPDDGFWLQWLLPAEGRP